MSGEAAGRAAALADGTREERTAAPPDSHGAAHREAGGTRRRVSMACGSAFPLCRGPGSPGRDAFQGVSAAGLRRLPGRPPASPGDPLLGRSPGQVGRLTAGIVEMYDTIRYLLFSLKINLERCAAESPPRVGRSLIALTSALPARPSWATRKHTGCRTPTGLNPRVATAARTAQRGSAASPRRTREKVAHVPATLSAKAWIHRRRSPRNLFWLARHGWPRLLRRDGARCD